MKKLNIVGKLSRSDRVALYDVIHDYVFILRDSNVKKGLEKIFGKSVEGVIEIFKEVYKKRDPFATRDEQLLDALSKKGFNVNEKYSYLIDELYYGE